MSRVKKCKVEKKETAIVFTFEGQEPLVVETGDFSPEICQQAMVHGFAQKLADSYAGSATVTEALGKFTDVLGVLMQGQWNGGRSSNGGIWVEALARAAEVSLDEAQAKWIEMDEEKQKAVKGSPAVKLAKAQIELERATAKADGVDAFEL